MPLFYHAHILTITKIRLSFEILEASEMKQSNKASQYIEEK